ncbi:hypothetical protein BDZ91DRAFT_743096 [Kalaharituber pfeilii]|nr:hypothetical protein BDZ91DRAFT_743096 [Kalaharituber pfeilii]
MSSEKTYNSTTANSGTKFPFEKSLRHLKTFPIVSDSLHARVLKPIGPFFIKVNDYASPYVSKADELADQGLGKVEAKFPILKEPTENVKSKVSEQLQNPRKFAEDLYESGLEFTNKQKEHILNVYKQKLADEESKGLLPVAKASLSTSFTLAVESYGWFCSAVSSRKNPPTEKTNGVTA